MKTRPEESLTLKNGGCIPLASLPELDFQDFSRWLQIEISQGGRIAACFASPAGEGRFTLLAVIARDERSDLRLLRSSIGAGFPSLTPQCPQLHLFEREIAEQYGTVPQGHPCLKPVRFHKSWSGKDAWGREREGRPLPGEIAFYRVAGDEVHEVAVGPVHAGVIEPGHFRFQCHGEKVMHLEISLGYQHRGVEPLLVGGPDHRSLHRVEAVAGDTSIGHAIAYAQVLESLAGAHVPARGQTLRGIALELERLANHVGDLGALSGDVGFLPTASFCGRIRGDYLNLTAELCGSRFGRGLIRPGGVEFDVDSELLGRILRRLERMERDTRGAVELFFDTPSVLARMEGVGKVDRDAAEALGLVGVAARACGLSRDARLHHPAGPYVGTFGSAVVEGAGDVFARANVRRREIYASLEWIKEALQALPEGDIREEAGSLAPESLAVAMVEGWRGEVVHIGMTDSEGRFARYKIVDPSFRNWSGLAMALRGEQISDFPLCNKSFNLSYCGFDL